MNRIKRRIIQWTAFGIYNADLSNFIKGTINKGSLKSVCVPGLNCYSCPGAVASCPLGALQSVIGAHNYNFSFYIVGLLLAFGVVFGRFICGFLCPFGLIQELLHKIPARRFKLFKWLRYLKYAVLVVFVIAMPLLVTNFVGMGKPAFCQYICPAGTLGGGIPLLLTNPALRETVGWLFSLKTAILALTSLGAVFFYRFFCRVLCPLGAIYSLFNRISFYQLKIKQELCIGCGMCAKTCRMGVDPVKSPKSAECIRCGECIKACPVGALEAGFGMWRQTCQSNAPSH